MTTDSGAGHPPAQADLVFTPGPDGRTVLSRQYARYPFHVARIFRLDDNWPDMATLYLTSISGGLVQNDEVAVRIRLEDGAVAHVTDSAAAKVHSMRKAGARQHVLIDLGRDAYLEHVAEPLILFPKARLDTRLRLTLAEGARAVLVESWLAHDPGGGTRPLFDLLEGEVAAHGPDGDPLFLDRFRIKDPDGLTGTPGVLPASFAQGAVYALGPDPEALAETLHQTLQGMDGIHAGASTLPRGSGAVAKILAENGLPLRKALAAAWQAARLALTGKQAAPRRK